MIARGAISEKFSDFFEMAFFFLVLFSRGDIIVVYIRCLQAGKSREIQI